MVDAHDRASRILDLGDLVGRFLTHELPLARILRNVFRDLGGFGFRRFFWEIWVGSELAEPLKKLPKVSCFGPQLPSRRRRKITGENGR